MLVKADWAHLIPHAGSMCLLDAVVTWDATSIHAISTSHAHRDHPLRGERGLHAVHLAEYGAQAMAVHGALLARSQGVETVRHGQLVSLRDVMLAEEYIDSIAGHLDVYTECLYSDDSGSQYAFRIEHAGRLLAHGRTAAMYSHPASPI